MGRSVNYLSGATNISYFNLETENELDWDDFMDNITAELESAFPSLYESQRWDSNEVKIFLENDLVEIAVSSYFSLVSISARPKYDDYSNYEGLAGNWLDKVWGKLEKIVGQFADDTLSKVGSFSNGEGVYERK